LIFRTLLGANPITQTPNGSTIILEFSNFFQSKLKIQVLRFVDKQDPQFLFAKSPTSFWASPTSFFFLGDLEIPQKREACIVAECCTHFPQLLVWERKKKLKLGVKMGKELKRIPFKYAYICSGFFLTPSPTSPPFANFTSAKNDLQY